MAKNALQEQLLKAGLVDSKKAKKISKQSQHAKRTGDASNLEAKKALADAQAKKIEKSTSSGIHDGCGQCFRGNFWEFWPIFNITIGIKINNQLRKQLSIFAPLFD